MATFDTHSIISHMRMVGEHRILRITLLPGLTLHPRQVARSAGEMRGARVDADAARGLDGQHEHSWFPLRLSSHDRNGG